MGSSAKKKFDYSVITGDGVYMGPDRREERRRECKNQRVETLLKNFGLDRRLRSNRRRKDTSWLLTSNLKAG